jgi:hypothetical protein
MALTITGHVLDADRRPLGNVTVSLKGKAVAESRSDGRFSVTLARPTPRVALTFAARGYVANTRVYDARGAGNGTTVIIWPIAYRVSFDPSRELDIVLGASRIQIPANVLAGPGREKLAGPARLQFTWFDITSPLHRAAVPGDFSGRLLDGTIRRLNSYGIFDFDIQDSAGRPLSLRRGASIELAIAVPPRLIGKSPRQIGFFTFDRSAGLWNQIGDFDLAPEGLTYNGSVTSFGGAHNLDDPQDTVCVTIKVEDHWGHAIPFANMTVHGAQYSSSGTADAAGFVCLLVQRNASFSVTGFASVGGSHYMTNAQQSFMSPDFSSGAGDCGDPSLCPYVGTANLDLVVG